MTHASGTAHALVIEADLFGLAEVGTGHSSLLIVDDTPANIGVLSTLLKPHGHQIFAATSGAAALDIAAQVALDLILLDVSMPEMDGFETCRRLKACPRGGAVPVMFVSARTDSCDVVQGFSLGAADYINKPIRVEEAMARINSQLQLRRHMRAQREQAERMRSIVDHMSEGLLVVDGQMQIRKANPAAEQLFGFPSGQLLGQSLQRLLPQANLQAGRQELKLQRLGAEPRDMELNLCPLPGQADLHIALLHDISRHKQAEHSLRQLAEVDALTQLANRRHFDRSLELAWQIAQQAQRPLSLLLLDVDHFKQYNDSLGHQAGDRCLQALAQVLQAQAAGPDAPAGTLAARYGGEEFSIILPADAALARDWGEAICAAMRARALPHPASSVGPWVSVSIGCATLWPGTGGRIADLFHAADQAMYEAKHSGRNRAVQAKPS